MARDAFGTFFGMRRRPAHPSSSRNDIGIRSGTAASVRRLARMQHGRFFHVLEWKRKTGKQRRKADGKAAFSTFAAMLRGGQAG